MFGYAFAGSPRPMLLPGWGPQPIQLAVRLPKRPSFSPLMPAVKKTVLELPAPASFPTARPQSPSMTIGFPDLSLS
jgi:hypothetical protein